MSAHPSQPFTENAIAPIDETYLADERPEPAVADIVGPTPHPSVGQAEPARAMEDHLEGIELLEAVLRLRA